MWWVRISHCVESETTHSHFLFTRSPNCHVTVNLMKQTPETGNTADGGGTRGRLCREECKGGKNHTFPYCK